MTAHDRRILTVSLTVSQLRALRAAERLAQKVAGAELSRCLLPLARALEALDAAWKDGRPDYGPVYRSAHKPRADKHPAG
jgi:hypothetical protein